MSRVLVTLANVHKAYGRVVALNDLSLDIAEGEFLTILGPSGSGKTTTLMLIAGFERPTRGEIFIRGESVVARPPEKRDIGMVFQSYALFPHMTVFDNVAFPLRARGLAARALRAARRRLRRELPRRRELPGGRGGALGGRPRVDRGPSRARRHRRLHASRPRQAGPPGHPPRAPPDRRAGSRRRRLER